MYVCVLGSKGTEKSKKTSLDLAYEPMIVAWLIVIFYILRSSVLDLVSTTSEIADCNQQITPRLILSYSACKRYKK